MVTFNDVKAEIENTQQISNDSAAFLTKQGLKKAARYRMNQADREDIVQTAIVSFLEKVTNGEYDSRYSPATYFFATIDGLCLTHYRSTQTRKALSLNTEKDSDFFATIEPQIEDHIDESYIIIDELLKGASETRMQIVKLLELQHLNITEITQELKITPQAVSLQMIKLREKLVKAANRLGIELGGLYE